MLPSKLEPGTKIVHIIALVKATVVGYASTGHVVAELDSGKITPIKTPEEWRVDVPPIHRYHNVYRTYMSHYPYNSRSEADAGQDPKRLGVLALTLEQATGNILAVEFEKTWQPTQNS